MFVDVFLILSIQNTYDDEYKLSILEKKVDECVRKFEVFILLEVF